MENRDTAPQNQLILTDRKKLEANGILDVESFDDKQIVAASKLGHLYIKGEALHITQLNLEAGKVVLDGEIASVVYAESKKARMKTKSKGIMERMFK